MVSSSATSGIWRARTASCRSTASMFASSAWISSAASASDARTTAGTGDAGSPRHSCTCGTTRCAPRGMVMPNSRSKPRMVLSRAVRVASQVERSRCNEATACWSTLLTGRLLGEIRQEPAARQSSLFMNLTRSSRDGDLKHRLCEVDGDGRMLHVDSSMPWPVTSPLTDWHDDAARQEESIPSAAATADVKRSSG
jgi:hypothetical protein